MQVLETVFWRYLRYFLVPGVLPVNQWYGKCSKFTTLSRTQAGISRKVIKEKEEISRTIYLTDPCTRTRSLVQRHASDKFDRQIIGCSRKMPKSTQPAKQTAHTQCKEEQACLHPCNLWHKFCPFLFLSRQGEEPWTFCQVPRNLLLSLECSLMNHSISIRT